MKSRSSFRLALAIRFVVFLAILVNPASVLALQNSTFAGRSIDSGSPSIPTATSIGVEFVQIADAGNIFGDYTTIDHPLTNGNQSAIVFVTPNWNPGGAGDTYLNHAIGVWYNTGAARWAVFNQDVTAMTPGAAFNVLIPPPGPNVFVQTATVANSAANSTFIDNALTNNNPNAILLVTPNWNPTGLTGVYNNHPIGVWYDTPANKWAIFNQDLAPMPVNVAFNVFVAPASSGAFVQTATATNSVGDYTLIDNPSTNGNPYPLLFVTPNYNPGGVGGTYDNHNIGVFYAPTPKKMAIFNQDLTAIPASAAFNVLVAPLNTAAFVHHATTAG